MANILVVDDSHLSRRLLNIILQQENHTVKQSENGLDALAKLNHESFDLLITDISMPVMDGLALLEAIRSDKNTRYPPVIVLTASVQERLTQQAMDKGATWFITQPYSSLEMKNIVIECLENSRVETCERDKENCDCVYHTRLFSTAITS